MPKRKSTKARDNKLSDRARQWLLGAVAAMLVVQVVLPGDSLTAVSGAGVPLVMIWTLLLVIYAVVILWRGGAVRFGATDAAVFALIAVHTISGIWATTHGAPRPALNMTWEWIGYGCCYYLVRQLVSRPSEARAVVALMIALAVGQFGVSMYQVGYEQPQTRAAYAADPEGQIRLASGAAPGSGIDPLFRLEFEARLNSKQPVGTFLLANSLAGFVAPWLVISIGLAMTHWPKVGRGNVACIGLASSFLVMMVTLILSDSRTAVIAAIVGLLLCLYVVALPRLGRLGHLFVVIAAIGALVSIAFPLISPNTPRMVAARTSLEYRFEYWQATMQMIADRPLLGCGPGNFGDTYTAYKLPQAKEEVGDPHNFLLEVWSTAGSFAAIAFLVMLICFAKRSLAALKSPGKQENSDSDARDSQGANHVLIGGAAGFLATWLLHGTFAVVLEASIATISIVTLAAGFAAMALLLRNWISNGELPLWLPLAGVTVLLVHLLGAGGVGNHGVAATLWVLIALGLNFAEQFGGARRLSKAAAVTVMIVVFVVAILCQRTAYSPVVKSKSELVAANLARANGDHDAFVRHLSNASIADPLAVQPARLRALHLIRVPGLRDAHTAFRENAPNRAATYRELGDRYLAASLAAPQFALQGGASVIEYETAIRCYPNSAILHAHLAWAHKLTGDNKAAKISAANAIRLDDLNPHKDYKLASGNLQFADPSIPPTEIRNEMEALTIPSHSLSPWEGERDDARD
jgi:hypothetical protein